MNVSYEVIPEEDATCLRDLCNELMAYQKTKAHFRPELFDSMCFETRMLPSIRKARANHLVIVKDGGEIVGYVYANVSPKQVYSNEFATFFDMDSVKNAEVGCLSQFYLREAYRNRGIGSVLFSMAMEWLKSYEAVDDIFIFVSNGNDEALRFYLGKGFKVSHQILDGFITVLRNNLPPSARTSQRAS